MGQAWATMRCFIEFEVAIHYGAYKGTLHSHVPFIGHKTRVEHLFAHLWSWRVVRDIWLGSHEDFAGFAMCMCASIEVGGFQGGHGKVELRCARTVQKHPLLLPLPEAQAWPLCLFGAGGGGGCSSIYQ